jgi:hypothetical protein
LGGSRSGIPPFALFFAGQKNCKNPERARSPDMPMAKRLRVTFYLLATIELILVSLAWGRLPLQ